MNDNDIDKEYEEAMEWLIAHGFGGIGKDKWQKLYPDTWQLEGDYYEWDR
jgi:hypothetical protein